MGFVFARSSASNFKAECFICNAVELTSCRPPMMISCGRVFMPQHPLNISRCPSPLVLAHVRFVASVCTMPRWFMSGAFSPYVRCAFFSRRLFQVRVSRASTTLRTASRKQWASRLAPPSSASRPSRHRREVGCAGSHHRQRVCPRVSCRGCALHAEQAESAEARMAHGEELPAAMLFQ